MFKKKVVSLMLAGAMIFSLVACGNEKQSVTSKPEESKSQVASSDNSVQSTEPVQEEVVLEELVYPVDTDVSLTFYSIGQLQVQDEYASYKESPFHSGLERMTGIEVEWQFPVKGADAGQAYNLVWVEDELPDIVGYGITPSEAMILAKEGLIWDLTEYLPLYAPDFWELLNSEELETTKKLHTAPDGKIYTICPIDEASYTTPYQACAIRKDWLDECGLNVPVTLAEFENVLRIFKDKYGAVFSARETRFRDSAMGAGTGAHGSINAEFYHEGETVKFAQTEQEYKDYLTVLNRWYKDGLIDEDIFGNDKNTVTAKGNNNEVGIAVENQTTVANWQAYAKENNTGAEWLIIEWPREAAGVPTTYVPDMKPNYKSGFVAVITKSATEEELIAALKFLNYGYSEEGSLYWKRGEEGVAWTTNSDGTWERSKAIMEHPLGEKEALKRYTGSWGTGLFVIDTFEVEANMSEADLAARLAQRSNGNTVIMEHALPSALPFTAEEQEEYSELYSAISTHVREMSYKFIAGEESLDKFDDYVKTLESMDLERCRELVQAAFDRYYFN